MVPGSPSEVKTFEQPAVQQRQKRNSLSASLSDFYDRTAGDFGQRSLQISQSEACTLLPRRWLPIRLFPPNPRAKPICEG